MNEVDDFLAHFGVKGMKWGVRKDDKSGGSSSSSEGSKSSSSTSTKQGGSSKSAESSESSGGSPSKKAAAASQGTKPSPEAVAEAQKLLRDFADKNGPGSAQLAAKFGPESLAEEPPDTRGFYERHKTAINVGAGLAVAGLAVYGGYKYQEIQKSRNDDDWLARFDEVVRNEENARLARPGATEKDSLLADYHNRVVTKNASFDPDSLPTNRISLSAGSIVKRISTNDERDTRIGGFYASFDDADVDRYKAILPTYWQSWGMKNRSGYVVNLKANKEVRAPSRREAYDIYREMIDKDPVFRSQIEIPSRIRKNSDQVAKETYAAFAAGWVKEQGPIQTYMSEVKRRGYNALIDENDAGSLSTNPMRFLDGNMFSIQPSQRLSEEDIIQAQINEANKLKAQAA